MPFDQNGLEFVGRHVVLGQAQAHHDISLLQMVILKCVFFQLISIFILETQQLEFIIHYKRKLLQFIMIFFSLFIFLCL